VAFVAGGMRPMWHVAGGRWQLNQNTKTKKKINKKKKNNTEK